MRIQILELPSKQVGECFETPFALVVDRAVSRKEIESLDGTVLRSEEDLEISTAAAERMKEQLGAQAVLIFPDDVEIG